MPVEFVFSAVAVIGGLIGAVYDLKTREVPNWINYFMILFGIGGHIIISALNFSITAFANSMLVVLVFYGIATLMFYTGQWGGGDAKMLIGFGALLPVYPVALLRWFSPKQGLWPFPATLFLNIILIGGATGLIVIFWLIIKNWEDFWNETKSQTKVYKSWLLALLVVLIFPVAMAFAGSLFFLASFVSWLAVLLLLFSFVGAKSIEKTCMVKSVKPSTLSIGDWLADKVIVNNKLVTKPRGSGLKESEIKNLIALEKRGKLKEVKIKVGLPFTPSFFLGLIASLVFGDIIFHFVNLFF